MEHAGQPLRRSAHIGLMAIITASLLSVLALLFTTGPRASVNAQSSPAQHTLAQPVTLQNSTATTSEINFAFDSYIIDEGAGTLVVTATLTPTNTLPVTVTFSTANVSAAAPGDYTAVRRRLTISPGTKLITTAVPIIDDAVVEGDEEFELTFGNPQNATLGENIVATVLILNNDVTRLRIEDLTVSEDAGSALITVSQSVTSALETQFNIFTQNGSAVAGSDYVAVPFFTVLAIPVGARQATFNITLLNDDIPEEDKTFLVKIQDPLNAVIERDTATVTLTDEDEPPTLTIGNATAQENDGTMRFSLALSTAAGETVQVKYQTADGTATAPDDYAATSGQLEIPAGSTTATITVPLRDDDVVESDETFALNLSDAVAAVIGNNQATGVIQNDDVDKDRKSVV